MIRMPLSGTPFILESMNIKQNTFLYDYFQTDVIPFKENGPQASSVSFKKNDSIKAGIGEQIERSSLYINNKRFINENILGIDLVTAEVKSIPAYRILLNWGIPQFINMKLENIYNDTCGVASHISSFKAIYRAFLESFERQCLLYNWFTNTPGKRIKNVDLNIDVDLKRILEMASHHVDDIHIFDISLCNEIKVIISIAWGKNTKGVGLCAELNYREAIIGSLKELFQYITVNQNNEYQSDEIGNNSEDMLNPLFYGFHFLKEVTSISLQNDFDYLIRKSSEIEVDLFDNDHITEKQFPNLIRKISNKLNLDFILCHIPTLDESFNSKIVKVLTTKGFHHMFAAKIDPNKVPFLSSYKGEFYNVGKMIPFG